jgi:hypothetical protein
MLLPLSVFLTFLIEVYAVVLPHIAKLLKTNTFFSGEKFSKLGCLCFPKLSKAHTYFVFFLYRVLWSVQVQMIHFIYGTLDKKGQLFFILLNLTENGKNI